MSLLFLEEEKAMKFCFAAPWEELALGKRFNQRFPNIKHNKTAVILRFILSLHSGVDGGFCFISGT